MLSEPEPGTTGALGRRLVRALAAAGTVNEATGGVLREVTEHVGARVAVLWLLDDATGMLRWGDDWAPDGVAEELRRVCRRLTFARGVGLPGTVLERDDCAWSEDVGADPAFPRSDVVRAEGLSAAAAAPLDALEGTIGVIEIFAADPGAPSPQRLDALRMAGRQLAAYLGRLGVEERLRASEEMSAAIVRAALDCVITMDHRGLVLDFNPAAEKTFGYAREAVVGASLAELIIPPEYREPHRRALARYVQRGEPTILGRRLEMTALRADGTPFPIELTVTRLGTAEPPRFAGFVRDITDLRQAEAEHERLLREAVSSRALAEAAQERSGAAQAAAEQARGEAELARRRLAFLAEASERMLESRDYEATLQQVARLAVPTVADWCSVAVEDAAGRLRTVAINHADPEKARLARVLVERYPPSEDAPAGAAVAVRTGRSQLVERVDDELLRRVARDAEHLEVLRHLAPRTVLVVPLRTPTRVMGAITFAMGESGRSFAPGDVALAEGLASRAALAIDNARLFSERSHIAETLQRSLLPGRLPDVPGLDVAARYRAAGDQNLVGGDFYDFFRSGDGTWTAILGDVSGKGAEAAALTALTRHTLRAGALRERSPAANLALLNDALLAGNGDAGFRFATVLYARVEPADGEALVTVSTGGHPPPLVVRAGGRLEHPAVRGTLLGALDDVELPEVEVRLGRGDLLLLFTDGVTEIRPDAPEFGERLLEEVLRAEAGRPADEVVAAVERSAVAAQEGQPRDDIALVALRVP